MLLAIDLGNTQTHIGMFKGEDLVESWRLATMRETTGDELATIMVNLLQLRGLTLDNVDAAILSSVVPQLTLPRGKGPVVGVRLEKPTVERTLGIVRRAGRSLSPAAEALAKLLTTASRTRGKQ